MEIYRHSLLKMIICSKSIHLITTAIIYLLQEEYFLKLFSYYCVWRFNFLLLCAGSTTISITTKHCALTCKAGTQQLPTGGTVTTKCCDTDLCNAAGIVLYMIM